MKIRIISSLVMLAIVIPISIIGGIPFTVATLIIGLCALKEMIDIRETKKKFPFLMKLMSYLIITILILTNNNSNIFEYVLDYKFISLTLFLLLIPLVFYQDRKKYSINDAMYLIGVLFFLGVAFNLLILVRNYSLMYLLFLVLITIVTDTFAYITGKYIGKTKLAVLISPKKTWEGLLGGTFFGVLISSIFYYQVINTHVDVFLLAIIVTLLSLVGQIGDLVFSSFKRYYDKKDFSNLIPGHGGILDRLDSIIFVLLGFVLVISFL
ncbi:MAG: phosphatidate cytidylyltransferase [Firmicutes bacterium]|nr:phosphatidate cytidylyltransferase [Bacillota bacterium]